MEKNSIKRKAKKISHMIPGQNQIDWVSETMRLIEYIRSTKARMVYIDLFCGFGGTTAGVDRAKDANDEKFAVVILGINHDDTALACHKIHHPNTLHLREDIRAVMLDPIAKMISDIRKQFPGIKIVIWTSAECTHHSRAKGGDSRDPDSRSLAEELYRYEAAIKPDLIQVENVTEFRTWGPLMQKNISINVDELKRYQHKLSHPEFGRLVSKNKSVWIGKNGLAYKKSKKDGITPWMIPIPERKAEFFNEWRDHLKQLGYQYEDKDINAADHGAFTARIRYYGQFSKGMPILWPTQSHCKDPDKHFLKFGIRLMKHKAVKEVLDFSDTGDSLFVPGRIKSNQTFVRVTEGGIKHIGGGKESYARLRKQYEEWLNTGTRPDNEVNPENGDFLVKYNSSIPSENNHKHSIVDVNRPAPTLPCRNMLYKPHFDYMVKHYSGDPGSKNYSVDGPAHTVTNKDHNAKVVAEVLPFIIQFNNNCDLKSIEEPNNALTQKEKFGTASFIQQRNSGIAKSKVISVEGPARTITQTGGNQDLVQVEKILPYLSVYHGNSHNCHAIDQPSPTVPAADTHALLTPEPFIFRQFTGGGAIRSINDPAGALMAGRPKMNLVSSEWIMETHFNNLGTSVNEPKSTVTADRHHAYLVSHQFNNIPSSIDSPSPTIIARQDKKPMHLAQIEYGNDTYYGIVIYSTDSPEVKELKYFMAVYGIIDIKMRMLKEMELLPIQGFPSNYIEQVRQAGIRVTGTNAKKYIGNSQEVTTAKALVEPYAEYLHSFTKAA